MQIWINRAVKGLCCVTSVLLLGGCASTKLSNLQKGTPVVSIYEHGAPNSAKAQEELNRQLVAKLREDQLVSTRELPRYEAWSRSSLNEIQQLFPKVENPTITMYVYPHLATDENVPVPGYTTAFNLYTKDQYALPGELPQKYPDRAFRRTVGIDVPPVPQPVDVYVKSGASTQQRDD